MATIFYAVFALKASEADAVAKELEDRGMHTIAQWLLDNKSDLYGPGREDWKPFVDKETIRDFLKDDPQVYKSLTGLIDKKLDADPTDVSFLTKQKVDLYIIDVFALFLDKYKSFADRMDSAVAISKGKCCLIIPYRISKEFQQSHDLLVASYTASWKSVYKAYREDGSLSRTVIVPDDLRNFGRYLVNLLPVGGANEATLQTINDNFLGQQTHSEVPSPVRPI